MNSSVDASCSYTSIANAILINMMKYDIIIYANTTTVHNTILFLYTCIYNTLYT